MKSLLETNPYLADPRLREAWLRQNALESSIFEGARGLRSHPPRRPAMRRSKAPLKKAANGS